MIDWRTLFPQAFAGARVCVTGGAGFIGSHLVDALVATGADVVIVDDLSSGSLANLSQCEGQVEVVESSILTPEKWSAALQGCRFVFHLAALGSVPRSIV